MTSGISEVITLDQIGRSRNHTGILSLKLALFELEPYLGHRNYVKQVNENITTDKNMN